MGQYLDYSHPRPYRCAIRERADTDVCKCPTRDMRETSSHRFGHTSSCTRIQSPRPLYTASQRKPGIHRPVSVYIQCSKGKGYAASQSQV